VNHLFEDHYRGLYYPSEDYKLNIYFSKKSFVKINKDCLKYFDYAKINVEERNNPFEKLDDHIYIIR
jgi:hypothetical protein